MQWAAEKVVKKRIGQLVPYARNSRTHSDAQIEQICASIKEWGWTVPVLIDESGGIIAGHGRVLAAEKLGLQWIPCTIAKGWTDKQKRAYVIADNKLTDNGGWDNELLASELGELEELGFELGLMGFSDQELGELLQDEVHPEGLTGDDELPGKGALVSRLGDVWICGKHRVMCGDGTVPDYVTTLCGGDLVDACWTDPPYNVNYKGSAGVIENDNMKDGDFLDFLCAAMRAAHLVMRAGAPIYVAHADTEGYNFRRSFIDAGFKLSGCLVWVKNALVLGRSDYQWRHEPILYGWKPGAGHSWYGGRANTTVLDAGEDQPFTVTEDGAIVVQAGNETLVIRGSDLEVEGVAVSTLFAEKPARSAEHPTMKPVMLVSDMLRNSTKRGDRVLDLFGGSGTTLIAAHKMGREARIMEFDPKFCDVIVRRWQDFTGEFAVHEGNSKPFDAQKRRKKAA